MSSHINPDDIETMTIEEIRQAQWDRIRAASLEAQAQNESFRRSSFAYRFWHIAVPHYWSVIKADFFAFFKRK